MIFNSYFYVQVLIYDSFFKSIFDSDESIDNRSKDGSEVYNLGHKFPTIATSSAFTNLLCRPLETLHGWAN